jgi:hypothetical protein
MGTGALSPGVKRGWGVMLTTHPHHPHLVPRSRMSRSYTSSHPMRLHGASMACSGTALPIHSKEMKKAGIPSLCNLLIVVLWVVIPCDFVGGSFILKMEAIVPSKRWLTTYTTTWHHEPQDHDRHLHSRKNINFKSYRGLSYWHHRYQEPSLIIALLPSK